MSSLASAQIGAAWLTRFEQYSYMIHLMHKGIVKLDGTPVTGKEGLIRFRTTADKVPSKSAK
jgi:hypothetical protein